MRSSSSNRCDGRSDAGRGVLDGNGLAGHDSEATHALQIWFWVWLSGSALLTRDEMCEPLLDFQDAERVVHLSRGSVCHDCVAEGEWLQGSSMWAIPQIVLFTENSVYAARGCAVCINRGNVARVSPSSDKARRARLHVLSAAKTCNRGRG